jgi:endonuclease I
MMIKKLLLISVVALLSMQGFAQIPTGYYDGTENLSGDALKAVLHDIIDNHQEYSYDDLRDFILSNTDEDPDNSDNVILLYTGRSQAKSTFGGGPDDWNREHVWAKSHGDFGNYPPCGTDAHHIRPTDASVNSSRGNKDFDNGGTPHPEATGCKSDSDSWEPRDEVKGDVARMLFYMAVRYEGDNGELDLEVVDAVNTYPNPEHGKLSALLEWHEQDPPDDFEIHRNEVIYSYQQNRNPFIDHPEFVAKIFGPSASIEEEGYDPVKAWFANGTINIEYTERNSTIDLYDLCGAQRGHWISTSTEEQINADNLHRGMYILVITDEKNGRRYSEKIIVK